MSNVIENWVDTKYPQYQVSNLGRVRHSKSKRIKKIVNDHAGYAKVRLYNFSKNCNDSVFVHRLVAEAFIPNPNNKSQVNHVDSVRDNNVVSNLDWVTPSENQYHAYKYGHRVASLKGVGNHTNKLSEEQVLSIFNDKKGNTAISKQYGISISQVVHIRRGDAWSWLTGKTYIPKRKKHSNV